MRSEAVQSLELVTGELPFTYPLAVGSCWLVSDQLFRDLIFNRGTLPQGGRSAMTASRMANAPRVSKIEIQVSSPS